MTTIVPRKSVAPYWSEIKKMSWEDRSNLAELIESSLEEGRAADGQLESFLNQLDDAAMYAAANFAYDERRAGHSVPHTQILAAVKEEMGWK